MARNRPPAVVLLIALFLLSLLTVAALRYSLRIAIIPTAAIWMAIGCWCAEDTACSINAIRLGNLCRRPQPTDSRASCESAPASA